MSDSDTRLQLLPPDEVNLRVKRLTRKMIGFPFLDIVLFTDNVMLYYLTGRVFSGWIVMTFDGKLIYFVRRPNHLTGQNIIKIRKPEEIAGHLEQLGIKFGTIGVDMRCVSYFDFKRLQLCFKVAAWSDFSNTIRECRSIKTTYEIEKIAESGRRQTAVYSHIPSLFRPGMTDLELQIEIERELRLNGCLGQFRISGNSMELFMANILAGDNADNPTPYDFAMGGEGQDPSLPVGANGSQLREGTTVMVDANGNFTGYMTDMTRTFAIGDVPAEAIVAHNVSIEICDELAAMARPGMECAKMYERAAEIAKEAGLAHLFMGHRQQAGFVGHGVGIEINEAPVIAPRSRDIIQAGNVFALEPKFVIPGVGAVGIENTYVVLPEGSPQATRCLTLAPTELIQL